MSIATVDRGSTATTTITQQGTDLTMSRVFHAPRALVWRAITEADRVSRWWGPHRYTTTVEALDLRVGGAWHFTNHGADGQSFGFMGTYEEVVPIERLAYTFILDMDGMRDHVGHVTDLLEDLGDRTRLTDIMRFGTIEALEGTIANGMVEGALETWDRLEVELGRG
jgi:uncharacterized protein YndB with AHSA1/START domain